MKKYTKRVLFVVLAIFIVFVIISLFYYYPMLVMPSVETGKVTDTNIYTVNAWSAVYCIKTDTGYLAIDAGLSSGKLQESLKNVGIDPNDVKWIFLTHSDGDHVAALSLFQNADIYMNEDELALINGTVKRTVFYGNSMPSGIDIDKIKLLADNQELLFDGTKIRCIKAPGHTIGSMVYLVDDKYLFTGDAFKIKNGKTSVHPYSMDKELSKKTIEQLKKFIDTCSIMTSHYGLYNKK